MRRRQIALAALLAAVTLAAPGSAWAAIALGELQAVHSGAPPYIFRLPFLFQPQDQSDTAVTVRSPADALAVVKDHSLELRVPRLTDVEIEVSHAGQTLNRLVLKTELHRARARLEATTAWQRYQAAKARDPSTTRLAALLETALETHHAWARVDPVAARQSLARVSQEHATSLPVSRQHATVALAPDTPMQATPAAAPATPAVDATGLEQELRLIRAEIQTLVGRVLPWDQAVPEAPLAGSLPVTAALAMLLGGVVMVGMVALVTSYLLQHRALDRPRQRRRLFAAGHVRLSQRTRRRLYVRTPGGRGGTEPAAALPEQTQCVTQRGQAQGAAAAELLSTIENLRHELISLRLMLPASSSPEDSEASSRRAPRG